MLKNHYWKFVVAFVFTALIAGVGLVPDVAATTGSAVTADCTVDTTTEWQFTSENMGASGGSITLSSLYLTWDSTNLYVGVNTPPYGNFTIYIDNGTTGGATTASWGGTHQIASAGVGYEYSFTNNNTNAVREIWNGSNWTTTGAPAATFCLTTSGSNDIEWAIPWSNISVTAATSRVTVLITNRDVGNRNLVYSYWPNVSGNTTTPSPSFTQGFIFNDPLTTNVSGYSPSGAPTAISLSQFTANNPISSLLLLTGIFVLVSAAFLLLRRRKQGQEN
jgi:hypothetical protein